MQQKTSAAAAAKASKATTKTRLIRAAERLFAENGLGAVSVRDITRAAGAKNESALHYHFGSKEALIRGRRLYIATSGARAQARVAS